MPCTDGGFTSDQLDRMASAQVEKERAVRKIEAMLCAICTSLSITAVTNPGETFNQVLAGVNWREAGVTRDEFDAWWKEHQAEDAKRRAREAKAAKVKAAAKKASAERARLQKAAFKKLTAAERKALGV